MLIIACMRSASSSLLEFLTDELGFNRPYQGEKGVLEAPTRNWRKGEGVEGYIHYPSSSSRLIKSEVLKELALRRDQVVRDHVLPIYQHRDALMSIEKELRKIVILKRNAADSFDSQMRRSTTAAFEDISVTIFPEASTAHSLPVTYKIDWTVDSVAYTGTTSTTTYTGDTIPGSLSGPGEVWECRVTPMYGIVRGHTVVSTHTNPQQAYFCHYESSGENREKCRQSFIRFRENVDIMFPEEDGFLHIEFEDLIANQDREIKKILDYWDFSYDVDKVYKLPHVR